MNYRRPDRKGIFITIEGSDGSGKSTQIKNIKKYMENKGIDVIFTREPGGTPIGEKIRALILDTENSEMTSLTEAFLYAAARAQHVDEEIIPALEEGKIVICDRFVDSSIAYQGYGRELGDTVKEINRFAVRDAEPDLTIFFDLPPEKGRERIKKNNMTFDRLEKENLDFHERVYRGYRDIIKNGDRYEVIDASMSEEEVKNHVLKILDNLFEKGKI